MMNILSMAKYFRGYDGVVQHGALLNWKLLHPDMKVTLFGHEKDVACVCGT
jgi:hypothetical protein